MYNDSLETLLLRHYGPAAATPPALEQRLVASVRQEAESARQSESRASRMRTVKISRRRALQLFALGSAGLSILSIGMDSLHSIESSLLVPAHKTQSALS